MDEADVYTPDALGAHRTGAMYIHHVDKAWIGYSTGVDVGEPGIVDRAGSLGEYLSGVAGTVRRLGQEWAQRVTVHGLGRGASQWLGDGGGDDGAVRRFVSELNELSLDVTLSLDHDDQRSPFAGLLARELEENASRGWMAPAVLYHLGKGVGLAKEPHKGYVSLAYTYGNVEFAGNLTGLGRKSLSGYVLGDPAGGGRLGVVTLNLTRLGHEARNEEDLYDRLGTLLETAVDALESKRRAVEESLKSGRLPETRRVLGSVEGHRSAVTLAGMNEALMSIIDAGVGHVAGKAVTYKVLEFISGRLEEAGGEHNHPFSLESYPCVEAGAALAAMDRQLYDDSYAQGENAPYYTAASELPPSHGDDLWQAIDHQKRLQTIYGGSTMLEVHLRRGIPIRDECGLLVERIMGQGFGEVKVSPLFSLCPEHGYINGETHTCPVCGHEAAAYTWVDGRPRPLGLLSEGLKEAHRQRVSHDVKSA